MARPRSTEPTTRVQLTLSLKPGRGREGELIAYFATIPPRKRAAAAISLMLSGDGLSVSQYEEDDSELDAALDELIF